MPGREPRGWHALRYSEGRDGLAPHHALRSTSGRATLYSAAFLMCKSNMASPPRRGPQFRPITGRVVQILFNAQQLIVLSHAIRAAGRAGLDLAGVGRYRQVGDGRVLRLAAAMAYDRRVTVQLR